MRVTIVALLTALSFLAAVPTAGHATEGIWENQNPASPPTARSAHAMATIGDGKVLLFGGFNGTSANDETWVYQFSNNTWTQMTPTGGTKPSARFAHKMADLGGGKVLLFGGGTTTTILGDTWIYDLASNTWTEKFPATSPSSRAYPAMAPLGNGKVLLFGGNHGGFSTDDETWIYDVTADTWTQKATAVTPPGRYWHAMAQVGAGKAVMIGGLPPQGEPADTETWVYDLGSDTWTAKAPATSPVNCAFGFPRYTHAMSYVGDDQAVLFGGFCGAISSATFLYDLSDNTWTLKAPTARPSARALHAMAYLGASKALLFGGDLSGSGSPLSNETWVYNANPSPAEQTEELDDLLSGIDPAVGTSLEAKLRQILAAIEAGDTRSACATLRAFIAEVTAQTGKKITESDAAKLIDAATDIMTALGCSAP